MELPVTLVDEVAGDEKQDGRQDQRSAMRLLTFLGTSDSTLPLAVNFWWPSARQSGEPAAWWCEMSSAAAWRWFALRIGEGSLTALWIREQGEIPNCTP
jgi:hypothetical protein